MEFEYRRPYAFIFDSDHALFGSMYGPEVKRLFFEAVLEAAPNAKFELRAGDILIHMNTMRLSSISSDVRGSGPAAIGQTFSDDRKFRATAARDFAESASVLWHDFSTDEFTLALLQKNLYCLTASDLSDTEAVAIATRMRHVAGYFGAFQVDIGNPVLCRNTFWIPIASYRAGDLDLYYELDPEDVWDFTDGLSFLNVGKVQHLGNEIEFKPLSARGKQSVAMMDQRRAPYPTERAAAGLAEKWNERAPAASKRIDIVHAEVSRERVIEKLTNYCLNPDHEKGGKEKARLFSSMLGITRSNAEYLAEQLIEGLRTCELERLEDRSFGIGYSTKVACRGLNGKTFSVLAAWFIDPQGAPRLASAYPLPDEASPTKAVTVADCRIAVPDGPERWQQILALARDMGNAAAEAHSPTPMFVGSSGKTEVVADGLCGFAWVRVHNGRTSFARWLRSQPGAWKGRPTGVQISAALPSQSVERAEKYCEALAMVLRANDIECSVHSRLD